jgi:hypothetical protein
MGGDHKPFGQRWISNFIQRNPQVASVVGRNIDVSRAKAATPKKFQAFLEPFERTGAGLNISYNDI